MFMPIDFILRLLSSLLSVVILGGGAYVLYEWHEGELVSNRWLYLGVGLIVWSFLGLLPLLLLRRAGRDEPKPFRSDRVERIPRSDGSEIQVEFYEPKFAQGETGFQQLPTIILTHGWGPDSTVWYYAKKQLTEQFRVIVWDLPGLGKSRKPKNRDYSLEKYARDLNAVIEVAGDQPVILLGHSMGAMILLTFSRLFPEKLGNRVAGLILVDGTYTNPLKTTTLSKLLLALQKPLLEPLLHLAIVLSPFLWLTSWLSYLNGSTLLTTEISGYTGRETRGQLNFSSLIGIKHSPGILARGVLAMFRFEETATLPHIPVPTLVIVGKTDIATRPFASDRMSRDIPQAELRVLAPGGHMALMEKNAEFAEIVQRFSQSCLQPIA
ncbi:alpha/beta fold hydrolase [Leptolyngbya ohadii]|uniref:alpha/beta fold hydrolase n=1 Tax=Leptolyngbya ohadii TaxID=1962290 RepID=UPI0021F1A834|nr:alpha/beta hydrolase [Leptolyngbya ohadii]